MDPASVIPHRPPILCIDRIVRVDDEHAVTVQIVPDAWEPWLIEGLAQTAAVLNAQTPGLLYYSEAADITDQLIARLNAMDQ